MSTKETKEHSKKEQALILKHDGSIKKYNTGYDYRYPLEVQDAIFNLFNGKQCNDLKLVMTLFGNADGFKLPVKTVLKKTGLNKTAYYDARKRLKEKGYIRIDGTYITLCVDKVYKDGHKLAEKYAEKVDAMEF